MTTVMQWLQWLWRVVMRRPKYRVGDAVIIPSLDDQQGVVVRQNGRWFVVEWLASVGTGMTRASFLPYELERPRAKQRDQ
jgi:hypothetical protein